MADGWGTADADESAVPDEGGEGPFAVSIEDLDRRLKAVEGWIDGFSRGMAGPPVDDRRSAT